MLGVCDRSECLLCEWLKGLPALGRYLDGMGVEMFPGGDVHFVSGFINGYNPNGSSGDRGFCY